jgi:hypothetical protein
MGVNQGAIREIQALMPLGDIILVGSLVGILVDGIVRIEVPGLFLVMLLAMIFIMIRVNSPEIPGMGMGRFHVGTLVILIGMGVEKEERREGEKDIGGQQEAEDTPAFRSRNQPMEG